MSERTKVGFVMQHFNPKPVSRASVGVLERLVGRCILAGGEAEALYNPATGAPCVYYHIKIEEEHERQVYVDDGEGGGHYETETYYVTVFEEEHGQDFYVQDGTAKLYIPAGRRAMVQLGDHMESRRVSDQKSFFGGNSPIPQGVKALLGSRLNQDQGFWSRMGDDRTGAFQISESSFDVNEVLSVMGLVQLVQDPYTGVPTAIMTPPREEMLSDDFFEKHEWSDWEKRSWHDVEQVPHVLVSDEKELMKDESGNELVILSIPTLPTYMIAPPAVFTQQMYVPYTPPQLQYITVPTGPPQSISQYGAGYQQPVMQQPGAVPMQQPGGVPMQQPGAVPMQQPGAVLMQPGAVPMQQPGQPPMQPVCMHAAGQGQLAQQSAMAMQQTGSTKTMINVNAPVPVVQQPGSGAGGVQEEATAVSPVSPTIGTRGTPMPESATSDDADSV
jgi:hypothetical protein